LVTRPNSSTGNELTWFLGNVLGYYPHAQLFVNE